MFLQDTVFDLQKNAKVYSIFGGKTTYKNPLCVKFVTNSLCIRDYSSKTYILTTFIDQSVKHVCIIKPNKIDTGHFFL